MRRRIVLLLVCARAFGQAAEHPTFEVASVKPAAQETKGRTMSSISGGPGSADPERATFTNVSMMILLLRAYDAKPFQVTGPAWLESERFDVAAKIAPGTSKEQFLLMMQSLLEERFHLALHHESKEVQGYELSVAKNGPKLKESAEVAVASAAPAVPMSGPPKTDANGFVQLDRPGLVTNFRMVDKTVVAHLTARAQPLSALVQMLGSQLRAPVVDKTGLTGRYDFMLEFSPEGMMAGPGAQQPSRQEPLDGLVDSGPTLTSAMQAKLGLKLEAKKVVLDMLVIDRVDKVPTEN